MTAKEFLESEGYEFPDKDFWMEDYITEHKFKDLVDLMERYSQSQKAQVWEEACSAQKIWCAEEISPSELSDRVILATRPANPYS